MPLELVIDDDVEISSAVCSCVDLTLNDDKRNSFLEEEAFFTHLGAYKFQYKNPTTTKKMPRGKYVSYKGRNRHFTNPEELEEQRRQEEKKLQWRKNKGNDSSSDEDEPKAHGESVKNRSSGTDSESESDSESETEGKTKGVENLIQIENPNRVLKKAKKLSQLNQSLESAKPDLSRREREQLEKQRAQANYQRLHAAGKTDEARADLARLAIVKQQREEAAKRREAEKKEKELALQKKTEQMQKALGKKS